VRAVRAVRAEDRELARIPRGLCAGRWRSLARIGLARSCAGGGLRGVRLGGRSRVGRRRMWVVQVVRAVRLVRGLGAGPGKRWAGGCRTGTSGRGMAVGRGAAVRLDTVLTHPGSMGRWLLDRGCGPGHGRAGPASPRTIAWPEGAGQAHNDPVAEREETRIHIEVLSRLRGPAPSSSQCSGDRRSLLPLVRSSTRGRTRSSRTRWPLVVVVLVIVLGSCHEELE